MCAVENPEILVTLTAHKTVFQSHHLQTIDSLLVMQGFYKSRSDWVNLTSNPVGAKFTGTVYGTYGIC